jgi:hypothetical protein
VYWLAIHILIWCDMCGTIACIGNTEHSCLWAALVGLTLEHSEQAVVALGELQMVLYLACSQRPTQCENFGWLVTSGVSDTLSAACQKIHLCEFWGIKPQAGTLTFGTSTQALCPQLLVWHVVVCLFEFALALPPHFKGVMVSEEDMNTATKSSDQNAAKHLEEVTISKHMGVFKLGLTFPMLKVVDGKNLQAWKVLLEKYNGDDIAVTSFMQEGEKLVGRPSTPSCDQDVLGPAALTLDDLQVHAIWGCEAVEGMVNQTNPSHVELLGTTAMEEPPLSFMVIPFCIRAEVTAHLGREEWGVAFSLRSCLKLLDKEYVAGLPFCIAERLAAATYCPARAPSFRKCLDFIKEYKLIAVKLICGFEKRPICCLADGYGLKALADFGAASVDMADCKQFGGMVVVSKPRLDFWNWQVVEYIICQIARYLMMLIRWPFRCFWCKVRLSCWEDSVAAGYWATRGLGPSQTLGGLIRKLHSLNSSVPTCSGLRGSLSDDPNT